MKYKQSNCKSCVFLSSFNYKNKDYDIYICNSGTELVCKDENYIRAEYISNIKNKNNMYPVCSAAYLEVEDKIKDYIIFI